MLGDCSAFYSRPGWRGTDSIVAQDGGDLYKQSTGHCWVTWSQGWPLHNGGLFFGLQLEAELGFQR